MSGVININIPSVETITLRFREQNISQTSSESALPYYSDNIVDFAENDPEDPHNWSLKRKCLVQILIAVVRMTCNFQDTIIAPAVPEILNSFGAQNSLYATIVITIWELGEGLGCTIIGPLSERLGRVPVLHLGNILFILFSIASALSTSLQMLVAMRFLNGVANSVFTLGPVIVSDTFRKEERGAWMAIATAIPMLGPLSAPIFGSFMAATLGWRWCIWVFTFSAILLTILLMITMRETYKVKILERRAARLRKLTGNKDYRSIYEDVVSREPFFQSMLKPARLLFGSTTVLLISIFSALAHGLSSLLLTTLTSIMEGLYGFSPKNVGITFVGRACGNLFGVVLYSLISDRYVRYKRARTGALRSQDRLITMLLGACLIPAGNLLYGWTCQFSVLWVVPVIATAIIAASSLLVILPTENYLADLPNTHSTSGIAASVILRSILGALLPLAGSSLYSRLGLGWGNTALACFFVLWIPAVASLLSWRKDLIIGESVREN